MRRTSGSSLRVRDVYYLHARASQGTKRGLCARARGFRLVSAGGTHLDVQRGDAQLLPQRKYSIEKYQNATVSSRWTDNSSERRKARHWQCQ